MRYPAYLDYPPRRRRLLVATSVPAAGLVAALALGQLPWAAVSSALASPSKRTVIAERATEHPSGGVGRSGSDDAEADAERAGDSSGGDSGSSDREDEESGGKDSDAADPADGGSSSDADSQNRAPAADPIPGMPASAGSEGEGPQVTPGVGGGRAAGPASHPRIATPPVPRALAPSSLAASTAVPDRASEQRGADNESSEKDTDDQGSDDQGSDDSGSDGQGSDDSGSDGQKRSEASDGGVRPRSGSGSDSSGDFDDAPPAPDVSLPAPGGAARSSLPAAADNRSVPTSVACTRTVSIAELARAAASASPDEVLCVEPNRQRAPSAPATEPSRSRGQAPIGSGTPRDGAATGATSASSAGTGERWTIRIPWLSGMGCMTMPNSQGDGDQQGPREITVCGSDGDSAASPRSSASRSSGDESGDR